MAGSVVDRLKSAWNAFRNADNKEENIWTQDRSETYYGVISSGSRPDRVRLTRGNERSIVNAVYNRIAMDVAAISINHVRLDEAGRFSEIIDDGLNQCFNLSSTF